MFHPEHDDDIIKYRVSFIASKAIELLPSELHEKLVSSEACMSLLFDCIHTDHLENQSAFVVVFILVLQIALL